MDISLSLKQKLFQLTLILCLFGFTSKSQAQDWPKIYGDNYESLVNDIKETYDNGFIISAFIYEPYGFNKYIWMIKTDINGEILWEKKLGDNIHQYWLSNSEITSDNGIISSGATTQYSKGDFDPSFIKLDVCGEIEWCRVLHSNGVNYGTDIIQIFDGSFVGLLTYYGEGPEYSRINIVKMDQTGEPIWIQRLAQEDSLIHNEEGGYLYSTSDSNYLISGECFHPGLKPFWIKTDTSGSQIWDLMWPGGIGGAYQVSESNNGFFYCAGGFAGPGYSLTPSIFKFDLNGSAIYQEYLMGDTLIGGGAIPIIIYRDSLLISGMNWRTSPNVDDGYSEIMQTDTMGNLYSRRILLNENKSPKSIISTHDNKILVTGNYVVDNNWDIYLWKMNQDLDDDSIYTQPMTYDSLCPYPITSDTVDLNCSLFVSVDEIPTKEEYESSIKISPNPAKEWISLSFPENVTPGMVELSIYDLFGRKLLSETTFPENRLVSLSISNLPSGIYLVVASDTQKQVMKGKFIVSR